MEADFKQMPVENFTSLSRKSWTAYVRISVLFLLTLGGMVIIRLALSNAQTGIHIHLGWTIGVLLVVIGISAYKIMVLRSYHLYYDDMGIWLFSGVLPWSRARRGVLWRDLDMSNYFPSFLSWILRSYKIRVGHRFTRSSEIVLTSMSRGDKAVATINTVHQELARQNKLS